MRKHIYVIFLLFILLSANVFADLNITVKPDGRWGNAPTSNIKALCENVALHFQEQLRTEHKLNGTLEVVYHTTPIAFYRHIFGGEPDEYRIGLTVTDTYWAQFTYQFAHEFCHVLQDHDRIHPNNPNVWFQEALCELANLWVIRRMSETWATRAPYPNWVDYRHALADYANNWMMTRAEVQHDGTGAEWLAEWEDRMRRDETGVFSYERVAQLSYKFLPIFEENPEAWNIIRQMPASKDKMSAYMQDWYDAVDAQDRQYVEAIATEMGITVPAPVIATKEIDAIAATEIDADVNDDGYVDIYDVLIVRSGMNGEVSYDTDVNNDGKTDEVDLLIVKAKAVEAIVAAAPRKKRIQLTTWGALKKRELTHRSPN